VFVITKYKILWNESSTNRYGSHNIKDWGVNAYLLGGKLKQTKRYQQAHQGLRQAKEKYGVNSAVVTGSSLGGGIVTGSSLGGGIVTGSSLGGGGGRTEG
jgi:hypothetical protein